MYELILFSKENFQGKHHHVFAEEVGQGDKNLGNTRNLGNAISSVIIKAGYWEFHNTLDFNDSNRVELSPGMYNRIYDEKIKNNSISSVCLSRVEGKLDGLKEVIIFTKENFQGAHHHIIRRSLNEGEYDLNLIKPVQMNNKTSSAIVVSGKWGFYKDMFYQGKEMDLDPGMYPGFKGIGMDNKVSSIKLISMEDVRDLTDLMEVVLFKGKNCQQIHHHVYAQRFEQGNNRLGNTQGMDNATSSLVVVRPSRWVFYEKPDYKGLRTKLEQGIYYNFNYIDISDNALSSVKIVETKILINLMEDTRELKVYIENLADGFTEVSIYLDEEEIIHEDDLVKTNTKTYIYTANPEDVGTHEIKVEVHTGDGFIDVEHQSIEIAQIAPIPPVT
ncbi:MAG: beta/gamma crystallin-related protein [Promethearchaeota archaeon]